jgi:Tol biopolymer transport system component
LDNDQGYFDRASDYEAAVSVDPNYVSALKDLAWLQTTSPVIKLRNFTKAIELAILACELTDWKNHECISILAAAYSETGDFDAAVKWQKTATTLLLDDCPAALRANYEARCGVYQSHKPYHKGSLWSFSDSELVATNLGPTVNSSVNEFDPSISADGLELYCNSYRPGGLGQADIWVARRKTKTDPWSKPVNLGPTVNSPAGDRAPCISADGLSLYFSSDRSGGYGDRDLWVTRRETTSAPWGMPVNLGPTVNSALREHSPSISTNGLTLYFDGRQSDKLERPGGLGGGDIWVTTRKKTSDPWGTPVNLGPIVNSSASDNAPSISDDDLTLYFNSYRAGVLGMGESDDSNIWVTTRKKTSDPWGTPIKLSPVVNADWECNPDISRDGSTLYFVSTRDRYSVVGCELWQVSLRKPREKRLNPQNTE